MSPLRAGRRNDAQPRAGLVVGRVTRNSRTYNLRDESRDHIRRCPPWARRYLRTVAVGNREAHQVCEIRHSVVIKRCVAFGFAAQGDCSSGKQLGVVGHLVLCFGRSRRDEMAKGIPASGTAVERTAQVSAALRAWVCVAAGAHRVWLAQPRKRSRRAVESWFMRLCSCSISKLSSATRR
jgi:hypothetical protein